MLARRRDALAVLGRALSDRKAVAPRALGYVAAFAPRSKEVADRPWLLTKKLRGDHGFPAAGITRWTSDSASPRACFPVLRGPSPKRHRFSSPFVALAGSDKPALSSERKAALRRRSQARRALTTSNLRAPACPSTVKEKPAQIRRIQYLCPRTGNRSCALTGRAYVLPRTSPGAAIPLVSVNTPSVSGGRYSGSATAT